MYVKKLLTHSLRRTVLQTVAQKRLNRSICCLGCGLGWAEGSTSSTVFAKWRQCALTGGTFAVVRLRRRCGLMSNYFDHLLWPPW